MISLDQTRPSNNVEEVWQDSLPVLQELEALFAHFCGSFVFNFSITFFRFQLSSHALFDFSLFFLTFLTFLLACSNLGTFSISPKKVRYENRDIFK